MIILTKINILRLFLAGICSVFLITIFLDYIGFNSEQIPSFEKLSGRRIFKRRPTTNRNKTNNGFLVTAPMVAIIMGNNRNLTVINQTITKDYNESKALSISKLLSNKESKTLGRQKIKSSNLSVCEDPDIEDGRYLGPIKPNVTLISLDAVEQELANKLGPGGFFTPVNCKAKHHVAIVVPFRDRYAHLSIFLRNMHPFLMKQNISYRIFIVEQTNGKPFNRAALMNVGYIEALKLYPWDCFIFHDIDLLPLDDRNIYNCPRQPRHMSVAIDTFNFRLPYRTIFGGVSAMTTGHFKLVNGFSNSFFGWGGEDDDMSNRIKHSNLFISRYPYNIARYTMMKHQKEKANPKRYEHLIIGISKMKSDGINSIQYEVYSTKKFPAFTWFLTELKMSPDPNNS